MIEHSALKELLDYNQETGNFVWKVDHGIKFKAGEAAGYVAQGYARIYIKRKPYQAHRLAWLYVYGEWPKGEIDHINRNKADNRIANLRDVTHSQNMINKDPKSNNTTGHPGVQYDRQRNKYRAVVAREGRKYCGGRHPTIEAAIAARKRLVKEIWGDFEIHERTA
jgi:hypothetical protein